MGTIRVGKLELDPAKNPAVLDTTTWDEAAAWRVLSSVDAGWWSTLPAAGDPAAASGPVASNAGLTAYPSSYASAKGNDVYLVELADGQHLFVDLGSTPGAFPGKPLGSRDLGDGRKLAAWPTDMVYIRAYLQSMNPEKGPKAWGSVPRLGIGDRHTTAIWPAAYKAMVRGGFAANAIQNSLRELNLLEDLKSAKPAHENHLFSFGTISEGHTGSTFEGLLHRGILEALKAEGDLRYGADADHIQVKRGPEGLDRAKRVIDASRYYTFYTLDVSDVLGYLALKAGDAEADGFLDKRLSSPGLRRDVVGYHRRPRVVGGERYAFTEAEVGRLVGKYWAALDGMEALYRHLLSLKGAEPFDMELSIDENPPEVTTWESVTTPAEFAFLIAELRRRSLPITHVAPNFGVEKSTDYRCPDGLEGLEKRVRLISRMAEENNLMLDCHSGDDLGKKTRQTFGRATGGRINFKVSPMPQLTFAEVLAESQPDLFRYWFDDVRTFVEKEAAAGSSFAGKCVEEFAADPRVRPGASLFHYYCFVSVGRREPPTRFACRDRLYELSPTFLAEYRRRIEDWLVEIAEDVYGGTG